MTVPSTINDIFTVAGSNPPGGGENPSEGDNHLRAAYSFIAALRDILNGTSSTTAAVQNLAVAIDLTVGDDLTVVGDTTVDTITIGDVTTIPNIHNANNILGPTSPIAQMVKSGTYTPTPSNITNVSSSIGLQLQYIQVGRVVTCSGRISITPTAAASTFTQVEIDPPVGTNFGSLNECGGTGNFIVGSTQIPIRITANTTTDKIEIDFLAPQSTAMLCNLHFTYLLN